MRSAKSLQHDDAWRFRRRNPFCRERISRTPAHRLTFPVRSSLHGIHLERSIRTAVRSSSNGLHRRKRLADGSRSTRLAIMRAAAVAFSDRRTVRRTIRARIASAPRTDCRTRLHEDHAIDVDAASPQVPPRQALPFRPMPDTRTATHTVRCDTACLSRQGDGSAPSGGAAARFRPSYTFVDCRTVPDVRYRRKLGIGVCRAWHAATMIADRRPARLRRIRFAALHGRGGRDAGMPGSASLPRRRSGDSPRQRRDGAMPVIEARSRIGGCRRRGRCECRAPRRLTRSSCKAVAVRLAGQSRR